MIGPVWQLFKANIRQDSLIESTSIVCAAWRFVDEKRCHAVSVLDNERKFKKNVYDDEIVVKALHERLYDGVDILLHQNGDKFDIKKLNARIAYYGLSPLPKIRTIDTLKQVKKHFALDSNKLDFQGRFFGQGEKLETGGMDLWDNIIQMKYPPVGKQADMDLARKSVKHMVKYNKKDVDLLIDVYERIKPYIDLPNQFLYGDSAPFGCPHCGSMDRQKRGYSYTTVSRYQRYQCKSCGKWYSDTKRDKGAVFKAA